MRLLRQVLAMAKAQVPSSTTRLAAYVYSGVPRQLALRQRVISPWCRWYTTAPGSSPMGPLTVGRLKALEREKAATEAEVEEVEKKIEEVEQKELDLVEKVKKLEALFEKDLAQWTPEERDRYRDRDRLLKTLEVAEETMSSQLAPLRREKATLEERLTTLKNAKIQLRDKLPKIPTVVTLEDFMALDLPFKKKPGNEKIAEHVFAKTVDRDYIFEDVLDFFVEREPVLKYRNSLRQSNKLQVVIGAPGTGKTHALDLMESQLNKANLEVSVKEYELLVTVKQMLKDSAFVGVSLANRTPFLESEEMEQVVSLRVLYTYFVSKEMSFSDFRETCRCTLENSLNIIRDYSGKKHVFVTVDEFTRVIPEDTASNSVTALHKFLIPIYSLIDDFDGNLTNFVFSSPASTPLREIQQGWSRVSQEHELRPLESIDELFSDVELSAVGQDLVKFGGGHVRSLKAIRDVSIKGQRRTIETNFSDLLSEALKDSSVSLLPTETAAALVGAAIGSLPVPKYRTIMAIPPNNNYPLTVDQIREKGYCATVPVGGHQVIPILTPAQIVMYVRNKYPDFQKQFQGSFRSRNEQRLFGGLQFELFHSIFDVLSRMLCVDYCLTRLKKISIRQLYNRDFTVKQEEKYDLIPLFDQYSHFESEMPCIDYFVTKEGITTEMGKKRLKIPSLMRFAGENPGFDSLIISPFEDNENKCHLTFIETRHIDASYETLAEYNATFDAVKKVVAALTEALRKENMTFTWHYVYALYRKAHFTQKDVHANTILMDRKELATFYGPSFAPLGICVQSRDEDLVSMSSANKVKNRIL